MNFELGKEYIVKVSEKGIIPIEEFKSDRFYDKDHDDLEFLTDEENIIVINDVLDKIREEIKSKKFGLTDTEDGRRIQSDIHAGFDGGIECALQIIDKYKAEGSDKE